HIKSIIEDITTTHPSSFSAINLLLPAFEDNPRISIADHQIPAQELPPFLIDHWQDLDIPSVPHWLWRKIYSWWRPPPPASETVTNPFLDFVSNTAMCEPNPSKPISDPEVEVISLEQYLKPRFEELGWFEDPRVKSRVSALRCQQILQSEATATTHDAVANAQ